MEKLCGGIIKEKIDAGSEDDEELFGLRGERSLTDNTTVLQQVIEEKLSRNMGP